jgi:hypothetical protein
VKEGERGGHRCADTWVLFVPPFNPEMVPQSSVKCTVEVCVPFSNSAGKVSVDMANEEVALAGTAAGQEVQQMLNADEIAPGDACEAWKSRFRTYLGNAIPGSTVSSVGTSMK